MNVIRRHGSCYAIGYPQVSRFESLVGSEVLTRRLPDYHGHIGIAGLRKTLNTCVPSGPGIVGSMKWPYFVQGCFGMLTVCEVVIGTADEQMPQRLARGTSPRHGGEKHR